eukprot:gene18396-24098_t
MSYYRLRPSRGSYDVSNCFSGSCTQDFPSRGVLPTYRSIINEFFNDIDGSTSSLSSRKLPLDIKEKSDSIVITADVPGVKREDIKVTVIDNVLTITTERKSEETEEGDQIKREERYTGVSMRSISLPEEADSENIEAKYENGVLRLKISKLPENPKKSERVIEVQ